MRLVHDLLLDRAGERAAFVALRDRRSTLTYGELASAVEAGAGLLSARGLRRGDRVVVAAGNRVETLVAALATARAGGVFVLADPRAPRVALDHVILDCDPRVIVADGDGWGDDAAAGRAVLPPAALTAQEGATAASLGRSSAIPDDLACLVYTSGSTGRPKGVMCRHANVAFAIEAIARKLPIRAGDVIGSVLPLTFDYGLYQAFLALHAGATLVLGEGADAGPGLMRFLRWAEASIVPLVPSMARLLLALAAREREPLPPIETFTSTGERLPVEQVERLTSLFERARVYSMYGLTECKRVSILPPEELAVRPGSVGRPLEGTECVVVDPLTQRELPAGDVGELVVRGRHVMAGYWRAPEETARRYRPWGPTQDRALFTGDLCRRDADGYLYFEGRTDDLVKLNGLRVSLQEIEAAATSIDGVEAAIVVKGGAPDSVTLAVVGSLAPGAIHAALGERLEAFKIPQRIEVLEVTPLTAHGKVDRARVAELLGAVA